MKLSEKLYWLRTEHNLTQVQFGVIAGASDKAVSTWERGVKEPRMKSLQRVCSYFELDLNQFVDPDTSLLQKDLLYPPPNSGADGNFLRIAGRDGFYLERRLSDEQVQALKMIIDQLPDADDL